MARSRVLSPLPRIIGGVGDEQWRAAFRAGGYAAPQADRFIRKIHSNIAQGLARCRPGP